MPAYVENKDNCPGLAKFPTLTKHACNHAPLGKMSSWVISIKTVGGKRALLMSPNLLFWREMRDVKFNKEDSIIEL